MVMDFSTGDKASGVKFCTVVHWRPGQGISQYGKLCSPRSPKSDEVASVRGTPRHAQPDVNISVDMRRRKIYTRGAPFMEYCVACGSACVDIRLSPKTGVLVWLFFLL